MKILRWFQFSSVAQSCLTLCNLMDYSTSSLPVHHQLLEFTQTHVHWVGDAIQPSHPLSSPSPPAFKLSQHQGLLPLCAKSHFCPGKSSPLSSTLLWTLGGWAFWNTLEDPCPLSLCDFSQQEVEIDEKARGVRGQLPPGQMNDICPHSSTWALVILLSAQSCPTL